MSKRETHKPVSGKAHSTKSVQPAAHGREEQDPYYQGPSLPVADAPIRNTNISAPSKAVAPAGNFGPDDNRPMRVLDDLEEFAAPPLAGKTHPSDAMDEAVPTLDDADRMFRHHPNEPVGEGFAFDPDTADAAADMAGDLGTEFLEGATRGQDMSDIHMSQLDSEDEGAFLIEEVGPDGEYFPEEDRSTLEDTGTGGRLGRPSSRIRPGPTQ